MRRDLGIFVVAILVRIRERLDCSSVRNCHLVVLDGALRFGERGQGLVEAADVQLLRALILDLHVYRLTALRDAGGHASGVRLAIKHALVENIIIGVVVDCARARIRIKAELLTGRAT